ncbi:hypothetical protein MACH16_24780 [Marinomonas pontica]|uniref:Uncharacterized protein n=1 Tax=Marinomonas pontica TaxID=264739 RepID=A0ABN6WPE7_9GAMM|nr:hypothetical protein MACH16_24780 [Marinomonas pontica]
MTSCPKWFGRVVSVYIPGRFCTGSKPLRTSIDPALYSFADMRVFSKLIVRHPDETDEHKRV